MKAYADARKYLWTHHRRMATEAIVSGFGIDNLPRFKEILESLRQGLDKPDNL